MKEGDELHSVDQGLNIFDCTITGKMSMPCKHLALISFIHLKVQSLQTMWWHHNGLTQTHSSHALDVMAFMLMAFLVCVLFS